MFYNACFVKIILENGGRKISGHIIQKCILEPAIWHCSYYQRLKILKCYIFLQLHFDSSVNNVTSDSGMFNIFSANQRKLRKASMAIGKRNCVILYLKHHFVQFCNWIINTVLAKCLHLTVIEKYILPRV